MIAKKKNPSFIRNVKEIVNYIWCVSPPALTFIDDSLIRRIRLDLICFLRCLQPRVEFWDKARLGQAVCIYEKLFDWSFGLWSDFVIHFWNVRSAQPKNENSPSCCSKTVWLSFLCRTQKEIFWKMPLYSYNGSQWAPMLFKLIINVIFVSCSILIYCGYVHNTI